MKSSLRLLDEEEQTEPISKRFMIRSNSLVMDLNFTGILEKTSEMSILPLKRDWIIKNISNPDFFFIKRFSDKNEYYLAPKLDLDSAKISRKYTEILNICLLVGGILMVLATFFLILFKYDVTHLLVDFTRMAKVLHRLKFINVNQTPLVFYVLSQIYNLF